MSDLSQGSATPPGVLAHPRAALFCSCRAHYPSRTTHVKGEGDIPAVFPLTDGDYFPSVDGDPAERVLEYIGANVHRLRVRRGMSQEALAEAANISPRFLQRVERGTTNLGVIVLVNLARALEVPPAALFRRAVLPEAKTGRPRKVTPTGSKPGI